MVNPNGVMAIGDVQVDDSIPDIAFIKFDFVPAQQRQSRPEIFIFR